MRTTELTMPLFSNEQIPTNAAPMGSTSENSKMMLSPPRSPQLGAGLVKGNNMVQGGGGGVHRPVPTKMSLNQLYGGVGGTTNKARTDPMFLPSADFFPATNTAPTTASDWDMLTLMRAKAKLAQMQQLGPQSTYGGHGLGLGATMGGALQGDHLSTSLGSKRSHGDAEAAPAEDGSESGEPKGKKRKKGKKPTDMPRRALSAYNIFFSEQRELILKEIERKESGKDGEAEVPEEKKDEVPSVLNRTFFPKRTKRAHRKVHGKIGLVSLARTVSQRWKDLSDEKRKYYQDLADEDKKRHKKAMAEYQERKAAESMIAINTNQADPTKEQQMLHQQNTMMGGMGAMSSQQYQQRLLAELMMARQSQQLAAVQQSQDDPMAFRNLQQMMMSQRMAAAQNAGNFGGANQMNGGGFVGGLPPNMF